MEQLQKKAGQLEDILAAAGVEKYAFRFVEKQTGEFNAEDEGFTLYRTLFDNDLRLTVFLGGRMGVASGNDLSYAGMQALTESALSAARAAEPDPCRDIAPQEPSAVFRTGCYEPDMDAFFERFRELLSGIRSEYPLIRLSLSMATHVRRHVLYRNANGTTFEKFGGYYELDVEFAANDGENTTGIDFVGLSFTDLDKPLLDQPRLRQHLRDTVAQLHKIPVGEKFAGTVILTPECLAGFLYSLLFSTVTDGVILNGTSLWRDRLDQKVTDEQITLDLPAAHPDNVDPDCFTGDGFRTQDVRLLDRGVLKSHLLSLFVANKTGRPVTKSGGSFLVMAPGEQSLAQIIASTRRGLIVGGFSGGEPEINGEFSGVAKNSFYVEDGQIRGAVMETMISGNLFDLFGHITALSRERVRVGEGLLPYLAAPDIVISGK